MPPCPSVEAESHRRTGTSEPRADCLPGLINVTPLPKQPTHWMLAMLGRWDRRRPGAVPRCASRWGRKPCLPCNLIFNLTSSSTSQPSLVPATRRLRLCLLLCCCYCCHCCFHSASRYCRPSRVGQILEGRTANGKREHRVASPGPAATPLAHGLASRYQQLINTRRARIR